MTVHGHQFSFSVRSSHTAANCLTRATAKVKVKNKNKKNSKHRNLVNIELDDASVKSYDFGKDIHDWKDAAEIADVQNEDQNDVCCLHALKEELDISHDTYATISAHADGGPRSRV